MTENRIFLRAFEFSDLDKLNSLRNDDDAFSYTGGNKFFISKEYDRKWIEEKIFNNQNQIYLAICFVESKEVIGYTSITEIDFRNRKAHWSGINIDKNVSGKGYATETGRSIQKFAFEELNLNRLYGYILESNPASLRMTEKLGFVKEGLIRDFVFKKNEYHNAYLVSILKKEYEIINSSANE
jgi:RimJ/RimL family protein N-acetyltransferase